MTEFKEDGALNLEATQRHSVMRGRGRHRFLDVGNLERTPRFTMTRKRRCFTAAEAAGDLPVLSGVAEFTTDMAIDHVRRAERAGCEGLGIAVHGLFAGPTRGYDAFPGSRRQQICRS